MKKRGIVVELIQDFITKKPGKPYEEVEAYAKQLNATYEELKEAIITCAAILQSERRSKKTGIQFQIPTAFIRNAAHFFGFQPMFPLPAYNPAKAGNKISPLALFSGRTKQKSADILLRILLKRKGKVFAVCLSVACVAFLFVITRNTQDPTARVSQTVLAVQTVKAEPTVPEKLYTDKSIIDPQKIFSYPPTAISLKYTGTPKKEVFGFFPYWMIPVAENVNLDGYTGISYFGLTTDGEGNILMSEGDGGADSGWAMWNNKRFDLLVRKARLKNIKIYVTIKTFNKKDIETIATSDDAQKRLIANIMQLVNARSLDGVNIDFEYLGVASDDVKSGFTRFIGNLSTELKRENPDASLSVDTYLSSAATHDFFEIAQLARYVDAVVVMAYDINTPAGPSGPISPLEGPNGIVGYIESYLSRMDADKIILAVPLYAYDWPVSEGAQNAGVGMLPYAQVSSESKMYKISWDETSQTPYYRYTDNNGVTHEVHFENTRSLAVKYDFVKTKNLKGIGVWAIGYDGNNQEVSQLLLEKFAQ